MTTTRSERRKRQALETHTPASPGASWSASQAAPALLIVAVTAMLLLSGCAWSRAQQQQPDASNFGEATSWLDQAQLVGSTAFTGP